MKILAIDMGTGTQDILLFDSSGPVENSIKLVMPSATRIAESRIRRATEARRPIVLTGVTQGGGPCHWALEDHLRAGLPAFATPEAARTFDDDLDQVEAMGITIIDEEGRRDRPSDLSAGGNGSPSASDRAGAAHITFQDLDLPAIRAALAAFDVAPDFDGLALACLDHGAAPPGYSDRLFRFDHLRAVVERRNDLRAFAMLPEEIPDYLTRARTMVDTARKQEGGEMPIVFLDTGPAAALGALQDERVAETQTQLVLNLGNMHALAFHLEGTRIISLYEHHTGEMTQQQIEDFTHRLITHDLTHEEVFTTKGHGVFYTGESKQQTARSKEATSDTRPPTPYPLPPTPDVIAVTGPQRSKVRNSTLHPYMAAPQGDMMISGCFGLLIAFAEKHPTQAEEILKALTVA